MSLGEMLLDRLVNILRCLFGLTEERGMASLDGARVFKGTCCIDHRSLNRDKRLRQLLHPRNIPEPAVSYLDMREKSIIELADQIRARDILPGLVKTRLSESADRQKGKSTVCAWTV